MNINLGRIIVNLDMVFDTAEMQNVRKFLTVLKDRGLDDARLTDYLNSGKEFLEDYFCWSRDRKLGRTRVLGHPTYVVYPKQKSVVEPVPGVRVVDEKTGRSRDVARNSKGQSMYDVVARDYFAEHPEPKAWHNAKPGETWLVSSHRGEFAYIVNVDGTEFINPEFMHSIYDDKIYAATRIWPIEKGN